MPRDYPALDEQALRRPEWAEGGPVTLADGQAWHFPCPIVRWNPAPGPEGPLAWTVNGRPDPEFAAIFEDILFNLEKEDVETEGKLTRVLLFAMVLMRNYSLNEVDARSLVKPQRFIERGEPLAWFPMMRALEKLVYGPVRADTLRARASQPPLNAAGDGPIVGRN
jgi:hypothetical protein